MVRTLFRRPGLLTLLLAAGLAGTGCGGGSDSPKEDSGPSSEAGSPYQGVGPGMGEKGTGYGGQGTETDSVGKPAPRGTTR